MLRFLRHAVPWAVPAVLAVALAAVDCGRSHDLGLGGASSSSSSSSSTSANAGGAGGAGSTTVGSGGASSSSTGTGVGAGPTGPTRLTVVDGINDYPAVLFCFLPNDTPWPGPAGLAFAAGKPVDIASALPVGADVDVRVIAGDLTKAAGMTCTQILAIAQPPGGTGSGTGGTSGTGGSATGGSACGTGGGSADAGAQDGGAGDGGTGDGGVPPRPLIAEALGVIPQSVLSSDGSLLLAPTGCMGGPGHDDPSAATSGCGMGYTSTNPTASLTLLGMSRRTDPAHVTLQVVNASAVLPTSDIGVTPNLNAAPPVLITTSLAPGAIGPAPPFRGLGLTAFGPLGGVQIDTFPPGNMAPTSTTMLGGVLSASQVGTAGFVDGAGLVLVAVGGAPGQSAGSFWHALTFALIKADPG